MNMFKTISKSAPRLIADEVGGETMEYALVLGLIVVAAIAVVGAVGTRVVARWTSVNGTL